MLTAVVAKAYLLGVSTRKPEDLVQALGNGRLAKSQVSQLAKELEGVVKSFRELPLAGRFKYLWRGALEVKCRDASRIVNVACLIAMGVNEDGRRGVLGVDVVAAEDGVGLIRFGRENVGERNRVFGSGGSDKGRSITLCQRNELRSLRIGVHSGSRTMQSRHSLPLAPQPGYGAEAFVGSGNSPG